MSATAEALRQFTIPAEGELEEIADAILRAITKAEEIYLSLSHASGDVPKPLTEFAKVPTLEDIGALHLFAHWLSNAAESLEKYGSEIQRMITGVDFVRREWPTAADSAFGSGEEA